MKTIELNPATATVKQNAPFTLPTTATATMSDSKTKEVAVTWNKAATTSALGTYTYTASYTEGSVTATAIFTLVIEKDPEIILQSIALAVKTGTATAGTTFTLPTTATATFSDSSTQQVVVTWDKAVSTATAGTFTYTASYTYKNVTKTDVFILTITPNIVVTEFTVTPIADTVTKGGSYVLPATGTLKYSDNHTESVAITWDRAASTATAGTFTYTGTNAKTTKTVTFTLTVLDNTKPLLELSDVNVDKNGTFDVVVNASFFQTNVSAVEIGLAYDSTMVEPTGTVEMVGGLASELQIVKQSTGVITASVATGKDAGVTLSGQILKFKFRAKTTSGTTNITMSKANIIDLSGAALVQNVQSTDKGVVVINGTDPAGNKILISDASAITNSTADVIVSASEFTETALGVEVTLLYDITCMDLPRDSNNQILASAITPLNGSINDTLKVVKEVSAGKIVVSLITKSSTPISINGNLFKVSFKTKSVTGKTTVSLGEVKVANSESGYITGITTIDTGIVDITGTSSSAALSISDAASTSASGYTTFTISGSNFTETATGIEINLTYDSTYMEIENNADIVLTGNIASAQKIVTAGSGKIKVAAVIYNKDFSPNGNLMTVKFKSTGKAGTTQVGFGTVDVGNSTATSKIECTATDTGSVTFTK